MQFSHSQTIAWHFLLLTEFERNIKVFLIARMTDSLAALGIKFTGHFVYYILINFKDKREPTIL